MLRWFMVNFNFGSLEVNYKSGHILADKTEQFIYWVYNNLFLL